MVLGFKLLPGDVMLDARMRAVRLIRIENDVRITATLSLLDQVYVSGNSNITAVAISELHAVCDAAEKNRMERKIQNAKEAAALEALLDEDRKKEREDKKEIVRLAQQRPPRPPPPPGPPPTQKPPFEPDKVPEESKSDLPPQTSPRSSSPVTTNSANSSISTESSKSVSKNLDSRTSNNRRGNPKQRQQPNQ